MNVVTFETAKRLKNAGFPQPEKLSHGQFYYSEHEHLFRYTGGPQYENIFFAPTATDILKELPEGFSLTFFGVKWHCFIGEESWLHENPAEACAATYLSMHEKTAKQ